MEPDKGRMMKFPAASSKMMSKLDEAGIVLTVDEVDSRIAFCKGLHQSLGLYGFRGYAETLHAFDRAAKEIRQKRAEFALS